MFDLSQQQQKTSAISAAINHVEPPIAQQNTP
jgi:hypothetical protein